MSNRIGPNSRPRRSPEIYRLGAVEAQGLGLLWVKQRTSSVSLLHARTQSRQNMWISRIADRAVHDKAIPDKQHGDGAWRSGDQACTLIHAIPSDRLTDVSRDKAPDHFFQGHRTARLNSG